MDQLALNMVTAFIDSFVEHGCLEDAIELKWYRLTLVQGGA